MPDSSDDTPIFLIALTVITGIVDAVSFLSFGHVFTANMTGNIVVLGFAFGGAPGISIPRSVLALGSFLAGAIAGGRMSTRVDSNRYVYQSLAVEAVLLFVAAMFSFGFVQPHEGIGLRVEVVVALTAFAMGLRNAVVRKLAVPDLTTTVLTLTVTGLAADSTLAGGENPRWRRRCLSVLAARGISG